MASESDGIGFDEDGALAARWAYTRQLSEWNLEPDRNVLIGRLRTILRQPGQFSVGTELAPDGSCTVLTLTYLPKARSDGSLAEFRSACAALETEYASSTLRLERIKYP